MKRHHEKILLGLGNDDRSHLDACIGAVFVHQQSLQGWKSTDLVSARLGEMMGIVRHGFNRLQKPKLSCLDIECVVMEYFNPRKNLIVPNVSWGMFGHEVDILVVTKSGRAWEIEIKVSKSDLIKDKEKQHQHEDPKISRLYFALPSELIPCIEHVPEHAGVLEIKNIETIKGVYYQSVNCIRQAKSKYEYQFTDKEKYQVARLGTMRILGLKEKLRKLRAEK